MYSNGRLNDGTEIDYAFALVNGSYRGLRTVQHSGALGGYRAQLLRFPDQRFSVIVLSNLAGVDPLSLALETAEIYLQQQLTEDAGPNEAVDEEGAQGATTNPDFSLGDTALDEYAGEFFSRELRTWYTMSAGNDEMLLKVDYSEERPLRALDLDHFGVDGIQIRFRRNTAGQITGFLLDSEGVKGIEFTRTSAGN